MNDLVTWLRAQLDDDEQWAQDVLRPPARWREVQVSDAVVAGLARRQLAEVDAKRRLLEQFRLRGDSVRATVQPSTGGVWDDLLRMLALPYADRPGYRPEWKP